jgi:hypothetical protein
VATFYADIEPYVRTGEDGVPNSEEKKLLFQINGPEINIPGKEGSRNSASMMMAG